jgi:hypothetical protein
MGQLLADSLVCRYCLSQGLSGFYGLPAVTTQIPLEQCVLLCDTYAKYPSNKKCHRRISKNFPDMPAYSLDRKKKCKDMGCRGKSMYKKSLLIQHF